MPDITLTSAPVTWQVANLIQGSKARGANGYVEFEASAVAVHHGGLMWLPSPQRAEVEDGVMQPLDLPINNPDVWNWKVTPRLGVDWPPFHINVEEGGTNLANAAIVPGKGPVKVLQGPAGASIVDFRDTGDGALVLILSDGTESPPVPFTRGPQGPANEIEIGTVLRGDEPYASLSGEAPHQVLNLVLPKGDPGNPEDLIDATPEQRGLMSAGDKTMLDALPDDIAAVEQETLHRARTPALVTYGTVNGTRYSHLRTLAGRPMPGMVTKRFANSDSPGTGSGLVPTRETPRSFARRTGAAVVLNGSGWQVSGNVGEMRGAQIYDGQVFHDFEDFDLSPAGVDALGVRADGTIAAYSQRWGDTAQSMVDDGVVHSWSHGPVIVQDGIAESFEDPRWTYFVSEISARQIVGANALGEMMVTTVSGKTSDNIGLNAPGAAALAVSLGYEVAVLMDGGGSAQTRAGSTPIMVSSDVARERPVPDAILVDVDVTDRSADTDWIDGTVLPGFAANQGNVPQVRKQGARVTMRRGVNNTGLSASGSFEVLSFPPDLAPAESKYVPVAGSSAAATGMAVVSTTGRVTLRTSATLSPYYLFDAVWWDVD